jgi:hypothetical protein
LRSTVPSLRARCGLVASEVDLAGPVVRPHAVVVVDRQRAAEDDDGVHARVDVPAARMSRLIVSDAVPMFGSGAAKRATAALTGCVRCMLDDGCPTSARPGALTTRASPPTIATRPVTRWRPLHFEAAITLEANALPGCHGRRHRVPSRKSRMAECHVDATVRTAR